MQQHINSIQFGVLSDRTDPFKIIEDILDKAIPSALPTDEETIDETYFYNLSQDLRKAALLIESILSSQEDQKANIPSSPRLLLFVAGCFNNDVPLNSCHSSELEDAANSLLIACLTYFKAENVQEWMCKETSHDTLCKQTLDLANSRLKTSSVKRLPFHRDACLWIMMQLKYPFLSDYLCSLLPLALTITDDYRVDLKLAGIASLRHIVRHSLKTQMRYYGQADVIYSSLKGLLFSREPDILLVIYPCLIEFLKTFDSPPTDASSSRDPKYISGYDEIMNRILSDIYVESRLQYKLILVGHLSDLVPLLGLSVMKHSRIFLKALEHILFSCDYPDCSIRYSMIVTVRQFVLQVWPMLNVFMKDILKLVMAFLNELDELSDQMRNQLQHLFQLFAEFNRDFVYKIILSSSKEVKNANFLLHVLNEL